jgi:hypothetical protein
MGLPSKTASPETASETTTIITAGILFQTFVVPAVIALTVNQSYKR